MEFYEVLRSRRSIRHYRPDPVPDSVVERLQEALMLAPSACNRQPWKFDLVMNPDLRQKIASAYSRPWLAEAPAIIVACGDSENCWHRFEGTPAVDIDLGIAMEHVVLAAAEQNLGTCWICAFEQQKMNEIMQVSAPWSVLAISPLGYPAETPQARTSKPGCELMKVIK